MVVGCSSFFGREIIPFPVDQILLESPNIIRIGHFKGSGDSSGSA